MTKKKAEKDKRKPGRKLLYGIETVPVVTKVPKDRIPQFKKEVKEKILKQWQTKNK